MTTERLLEIRTYEIQEGRREVFGDRMAAVVPMLNRYGIDVVGHGPSLEDDRHYVLLRSFASSAELMEQEQAFYDGREWRTGPRAGILEFIDAYHTVVLRSTDDAIRALAASLTTTGVGERRTAAGDIAALTERNAQFVDAFRKGQWTLLAPILTSGFSYLDGATGEVWPMERYIADLEAQPLPTIEIDQLRIHVDRDTAIVSARSSARPGRFNRYVDTYVRRNGGWLCVHACVWPLSLTEDL
jgi:hypothetical protein